jgi:hypothetical protein
LFLKKIMKKKKATFFNFIYFHTKNSHDIPILGT